MFNATIPAFANDLSSLFDPQSADEHPPAVGADLATLSPREQAVLDRAFDYGECYWARVNPTDDLGVEAMSDMGDPDTRVVLRAPRGMPNRKLLLALDAAIQVLMRVD